MVIVDLCGAHWVHGLDAVLRADFSDSIEVSGIAAKRQGVWWVLSQVVWTVYLTVGADRVNSLAVAVPSIITTLEVATRHEGTGWFADSFQKKVINVDRQILGVVALVRIEFSGHVAEGKIILSLVILSFLMIQLYLTLLLIVCGHQLQSMEVVLLGLRISLCPSLSSGPFIQQENFILHLIAERLLENWHVSIHFVLRYLKLFNWFSDFSVTFIGLADWFISQWKHLVDDHHLLILILPSFIKQAWVNLIVNVRILLVQIICWLRYNVVHWCW